MGRADMGLRGAIAIGAGLLGVVPAGMAKAAPATNVTQSELGLPALRSPAATFLRVPPAIPLPTPPPGAEAAPPPGAQAAPPAPPAATPTAPTMPETGIDDLKQDMAQDVHGLLRLSPRRVAAIQAQATAMLHAANTGIDAPQLVIVVDRAPVVQTLAVMLARPGGKPWSLIGAAHVSTGQAGRKDYYITPVGVFRHTDAILDFRALGTYNEHHVRGLGEAGMRVWDFGWQWALKGWHTDGAGGDIRLQMHATDPKLLEQRIGRPASEGCIRVSSTMNKFLDQHGVLDADIERAAITDIRYRALLGPDHEQTLYGGRLLIVIDNRDPMDEAPTQASRPANWPPPPDLSPQVAVQE